MIDGIKISAYMIVYNGAYMMKDAILSIADIVDEWIIVDGTYKFVEDVVGDEEVCDQSVDNIDSILSWLSADTTKYFKGVWENEVEKRAFAFSQCQYPIIITIDTDEIYEIDKEKLAEFVNSLQGVGHLENHHFVDADCLDRAITYNKNVIFKRGFFTAEEHCDYLSLVNAKQNPKNTALIYDKSLGRLNHFCELRPPEETFYRYLFYFLLCREDVREEFKQNIEEYSYATFKDCIDWNANFEDGFPEEVFVVQKYEGGLAKYVSDLYQNKRGWEKIHYELGIDRIPLLAVNKHVKARIRLNELSGIHRIILQFDTHVSGMRINAFLYTHTSTFINSFNRRIGEVEHMEQVGNVVSFVLDLDKYNNAGIQVIKSFFDLDFDVKEDGIVYMIVVDDLEVENVV